MVISSQVISKLLPHKYPFLLLDKVIELEPGKRAVGIKNVTINEPYFQGHFPGEPIVPGVLLIESLAQLAAVMYCTGHFPAETDWSAINENEIDFEKIASGVGYLAEVKTMKFKTPVKPGDTLKLRTIKKAQFANLSQIKVDAYVESRCVCEGTLTVSER